MIAYEISYHGHLGISGKGGSSLRVTVPSHLATALLNAKTSKIPLYPHLFRHWNNLVLASSVRIYIILPPGPAVVLKLVASSHICCSHRAMQREEGNNGVIEGSEIVETGNFVFESKKGKEGGLPALKRFVS